MIYHKILLLILLTGGDNQSTIYWLNISNEDIIESPASAKFQWYEGYRYIHEVDMFFNAYRFRFYTDEDTQPILPYSVYLEGLALEMLGHILGISIQ